MTKKIDIGQNAWHQVHQARRRSNPVHQTSFSLFFYCFAPQR